MPQEKALSNLQIELLKVFSMDLTEKELLEIRNLLSEYFSKKAMDLADKVWEEKGWTMEEAERMAYSKMRSSKKAES
jgi:hypothetical protein